LKSNTKLLAINLFDNAYTCTNTVNNLLDTLQSNPRVEINVSFKDFTGVAREISNRLSSYAVISEWYADVGTCYILTSRKTRKQPTFPLASSHANT